MAERSAILSVGDNHYTYYPVNQVEGHESLPYSLTVLLENVLRNVDDPEQRDMLARRIVEAGASGQVGEEIEFSPARVLFQDFTGVPVFVDFAVMREACSQLGGDPKSINPQIPCDLVIDHSVIADSYGCADAMEQNMALEFERNKERYDFLKWAQESFENVRIVPPGEGICHQLNIERFAQVTMTRALPDGTTEAYFDTLVGTDSHTPTANGIGVLGWGVGGIEAEAAALGQPITTLVPRVIGVELVGQLPDDVTAMDLSLTFAQMLRQEGVVGCFVEVFGPGVETLTATQRACVSNMTPEYGCTCTLFPVDDKTIDYLKLTGRSSEQAALVEVYAKTQGFWNDPTSKRSYAKVLKLDLGEVRRSLAGPSRPHDRFNFDDAKAKFDMVCAERGLDLDDTVTVSFDGQDVRLTHGALAIAAVTSCTTATDASMMLTAGLLARNAAACGLAPKPWVKTILAPGSKATQDILAKAELLPELQKLGFYTCGLGCMSCIGNSGPVLPQLHEVADKIELASILSGNRNFDGRISPDVSQNYLCAPALVVAYSLVGTMDFDFENEPLTEVNGKAVYLADIWPERGEVEILLDTCCTSETFAQSDDLYAGTPQWRELSKNPSDTFEWDEASTYVRRAPYFDGMGAQPEPVAPITQARALLNLGDFITTDHISPAGSIAAASPAAVYLEEHGVVESDFNTYGARRGNHEVMERGTFANVKLVNKLADGKKGGWTLDQIDGEVKPVWDAAEHYREEGVESIVLAGKMYGSGSSRDWAAKGPMLQGVRAALAESFERIHRSNLIGMGILPLQFIEGQGVEALGLDGTETFTVEPIDFSDGLPNPAVVSVKAVKANGDETDFEMTVRIDTPTEGAYYRNGGILQYVLRDLAGA